MAEASIPVDLFNPGQVFACLGFLEAADVLLGDAEGGFDWSDEVHIRFILRAGAHENPFAVVLKFLAEAEVRRCAPVGYADPPTKKAPNGKLRLMYEANPMSMIVEQAGGKSMSAPDHRMLDIQPTDIHQRVPVVMGSVDEVDKVIGCLR